jgi:hypothetical protein
MDVRYLEGIRGGWNGNGLGMKKPADLEDMRVYFFFAKSI